ncbi:trimeric intracellular cation channel family protein [Geminicoccaceae bacterium 1502E]|nr:trimeric intracellular cation channel family protein [Geminicoccaceae bacterium 1502E]
MHVLPFWLDALGVFVFALSGALNASRKELDIVGFILVASVTGVGGGTLRDLLLGRPVFWVGEPEFLLVTSVAAVLVYFTAPQLESRYRVLLWFDALGLSIYSVLGAGIARSVGADWSVAILMGVMTATFGGLIRDVICNETPLILRREVYASAAAAGAGMAVLLLALGLPELAAALTGFATALTIRGAALLFELSIPTYRPRPGRDYPPR